MTLRRLLDYWSVILVFTLFFGFLLVSVTRNLTYTMLQSRVTTAVADVRDLNTSVTQMLADAGASPGAFLRTDQFALITFGLTHGGSVRPVDAATEVYSHAFRALLEYGRSAPLICASSGDSAFAQVFDPVVVSRLAKNYGGDLTDPWGQPYWFHPTPDPNFVDHSGAPVCIWSTGADRISQTLADGEADDISNWDVQEKWRAAYKSMPFWQKFAAAFL